MDRYFTSNNELQCIFVLYGLGGSGKSQIAFKFLQESRKINRYGSVNEMTSRDNNLSFGFLSFSDVFYIDATNEQTLHADLITITPEGVDRSVDACLRWLAKEPDGSWLLFFDNADDVHLNLRRYFPRSGSGNILITTRNPELSAHSGKEGDADATVMDHKDAKNLLLRTSREEESDRNEISAKKIAQVLSLIFFI